MVLFDNEFYSDEDCCSIIKTSEGWRSKPFSRQTSNKSNTADRTPFQVDLDRLTFSEAFRRLQGKTQVRKTGAKCFSRTRLSHSIEVARIARSIVSKIHIIQGLPFGQFIDPDLVEFACFAHDIGNPPFGHAGERELNRQMQKYGGFEGNAQSLRIVTETAWNTGGIEPTKAGTDAILKYKDLWSAKTAPTETRRQFLYDYQGQLLKHLDGKRGRIDRESDVLYKRKIIGKEWHSRLQKADESTKFRIICDFLSAMTDDYAQMLFKQSIEVAL